MDFATPVSERSAVRVIELAGLALLCGIAELTLWGGAGGLGEATLFVTVPAIVILLARERVLSRRLVGIAILLALVVARSLWQSSVGTIVAGSALLLAFSVGLRSSRPHVAELLVSAFVSIGRAFGESIVFARAGAALATPKRFERVRAVTVVVPLVIVLVFTAIFAAANPLVERWTAFAAERFFSSRWLPSWAHVAFWGACVLGSVALVRPALRLFGWTRRLGPDDALVDDGVPCSSTALATSRNVLVGVNLLFLAYNALDAVYLWAGRPPRGIDHKEYAHRGALWLTVALALSTLVLGLVFGGRTSFDARARALRALAYTWAAQNFVLAAGTFRRIAIYVSDSGLTQLRIVGIFGTALVVVGLGLLVAKLARRRTVSWLVRGQLDAFAIATVLFIVTPTHAIATRFNVARISEGQYRPLPHFFEQATSEEGMVEVLPLLDHPDPIVRRGAAAFLASYSDFVSAADRSASCWAQWEGSRREAARRLADARPAIDALVPDFAARASALDALRAVAYAGPRSMD